MKHHSKPKVGVSDCLLGKNVRFDGGHKKCEFVQAVCADMFDLYPVCPEVELGLGTPRPAIQLRAFPQGIRLVRSRQTTIDITDEMDRFSQARVKSMDELDGFIFKKDSPSCGMERVPVYSDKTGMRERSGRGRFAEAFISLYPDVPVEDEGRLNDIKIRENFLERVYAHLRWRKIDENASPIRAFRDYHKNYKLVLMAKDTEAYRALGRMASSVNQSNMNEVRKAYMALFMKTMAKQATPGQHINVLMHISGYLKKKINSSDKHELSGWFEAYRQEKINRVTLFVLMKHHFKNYPNEYIKQQYYFEPYPADIMLPV